MTGEYIYKFASELKMFNGSPQEHIIFEKLLELVNEKNELRIIFIDDYVFEALERLIQEKADLIRCVIGKLINQEIIINQTIQ